MFGVKVRNDTSEPAAAIWHKLIPSAAIVLQVMLESFLSASFGSETCSGTTEGIFRTVAFLLAWLVGLMSMKWQNFQSDQHLSDAKKTLQTIKHALVNIGVVTSWVFAVSDFPLKCWIGGKHDKSISALRGMLVILAQVIVSFELLDLDIGGEEEEEGVSNETTGLVP